MEYLQVFDENKRMLDEKIEREKKLELPDKKYFMIILLFIQNEKGELLVQKTSVNRNSELAFTGGHVTFGDDGFKTVIKEAKEELGIDLLPDEVKLIDTLCIRSAYVEIYYTNKKINIDDLKLQKEEVDYVKWYSIDQINEFIEDNNFRKGHIVPYKTLLKHLNNIKD